MALARRREEHVQVLEDAFLDPLDPEHLADGAEQIHLAQSTVAEMELAVSGQLFEFGTLPPESNLAAESPREPVAFHAGI